MFWKEKRKKYIVSITVRGRRELQLANVLEHWNLDIRNTCVDEDHPISLSTNRRFTRWEAMRRCMRYSKMGIDTCMLKDLP